MNMTWNKGWGRDENVNFCVYVYVDDIMLIKFIVWILLDFDQSLYRSTTDLKVVEVLSSLYKDNSPF